jgi:hypothetical protein
MKKFNFFVMILLFSVLYSCQQDENDMYVKNYNFQPQFSVYDPSSVKEVLTYMDSAYYFEHLDSNYNLVNAILGKYMDIAADTNGNDRGFCATFPNSICMVGVHHQNYSNPCNSLIENYYYDTTLNDKDFLVVCTENEPILYQGNIESFSEGKDGKAESLYFDWLQGYITFKNDTIIYENE